MSNTFSYQHTVQFHETDSAGLVHFSNYYKWMEMAEHAFFRFLGEPMFEEKNGRFYGYPRVHAQCDFSSPIGMGDVLILNLTVSPIDSKKLNLEVQFMHENKEVAKGKMLTVYATRIDGKLQSLPLPESLLNKIPALKSH